MTSPYSSLNIYSLQEISMIAGSYKELIFDVFSLAGSAIDITSASLIWNLSPYGDPSYNALSIAGSPLVSGSVTYQYVVVLNTEDTEGLNGKYIQQPTITSVPGSTQIPAQGLITIIPKLASS